MAPLVYIFVALTTGLCATFLLAGFAKGRNRLLLWSGLCFAGLAISNVIVFLDLVVVPGQDLFRWRLGVTTVAMSLLLYGLIWDSE